MEIVCISRGSYSYGKNLAEKLGQKLGSIVISREMITDEAADFGIRVGKAEVAVLKNRSLPESMAVELDLFKAFVTKYLCSRALEQSIVYHGRTGHLVLPGLSHVLRIRVIAPLDSRINFAINRMNLPVEKARDYIEKVDDDIHRWVRKLYNVDWDDPSLYDLTINAQNLLVENAASALVSMSELPEVQATPSSRQFLKNLLLASTCRLAIGKDERTRNIKASVQANHGTVSVTYPPHQSTEAGLIPDVLKSIEEINSLVCTVATTNILCIGEEFNPADEAFDSLIAIAEKWNAAVELIQLSDEANGNGNQEGAPSSTPVKPQTDDYNGGILDDTHEDDRSLTAGGGVSETLDRLIQVGRAGRFQKIEGGIPGLIQNLPRAEDYCLVVVGSVFTKKKMAQQHLKRELMGRVGEKFRVPILGMEELKSRYLFGAKQLMSLLVALILAIGIFFVVFEYQEPLLTFVSKGRVTELLSDRILAAVAIFAFVPILAFCVGTFYHNLLKLLKLE